MLTRLMSKSDGHAGWSGGKDSGIGAAAEPLTHRPRQREDFKAAGRRLEDGRSISGRAVQRARVDHARATDAFITHLMRMSVQQVVHTGRERRAHRALNMTVRKRDGSVVDCHSARRMII